MYILTPEQLSKADKATIATNNISSIELMEYAATQCFNWLHNRLQGQQIKIHVFCGVGNNGGDGLVIARHLLRHGYNFDCFVVNFTEKRTPEFLENYGAIKELGTWPTIINSKEDFPTINFEDIVIDAIFGNGISRTPQGFTKHLIQYINSTKVFTLSIDLPSGLFSNKSVKDLKSVIKAGHILTFQTPKLALLLPENKDFVKSWEIIDIELDETFIESLNSKIHYITKEDAQQLYKPRAKWDHKGNYGHSLLIGGSFGKIGAMSLASKAALKIGSGLVTSYIPKCGYLALQIAIPEVMVEVDEEETLTYFNFKTKASVIGVGPGMGTSENTAKGFEKFLEENTLPLIIDADALNIISNNKSLLNKLPSKSILTPHPKELERLIGKWDNDYQKLEKATEFSNKNDVILVIKGAHTATIYNQNIYFNSTGNPALATAGSGDVLTGIITGLVAQGYEQLNAAILGVYLHGKTADIGIQKTSIESFTASTIIEYISDAYIDLFIEDPSNENLEDQQNDMDEDNN